MYLFLIYFPSFIIVFLLIAFRKIRIEDDVLPKRFSSRYCLNNLAQIRKRNEILYFFQGDNWILFIKLMAEAITFGNIQIYAHIINSAESRREKKTGTNLEFYFIPSIPSSVHMTCSFKFSWNFYPIAYMYLNAYECQ